MNFIAVIPARYASTRFEGKPLVDILGKPMVVRVYQRVSEIFEHCVIATDNEKIRMCALEAGCNVVMTSETHQTGTDRCFEALALAEQLFSKTFDVVVNVQGDEPFIHQQQLKDIQSVFNNPSVEIATLIKKFGDNEDIFNPNTPKVLTDSNNRAIYFSRSAIPHLRGIDPSEWHLHHPYYKHIGLYAYRSSTLKEITALNQSTLEKCESLEQLRWLESGYYIKCVETLEETHAIDTPQDLERVIEIYAAKK